MIQRMILCFTLLLAPALASAQIYEGRTCDCGTTKTQVKTKGSTRFPTVISWDGYAGDLESNASSCLYAGFFRGPKVSAKLPKSTMSGDENDDLDAWEQTRRAWVTHTCRYSANQVGDNHRETSWCEGVAGDGVGESVGVYAGAKLPTAVRIFPGFGKSKAAFRKNGRPKTVRVHLLGIGKVDPTQVTIFGGKLAPLSKTEATLADTYGYQQVALQAPKTGLETKFEGYAVVVEILSVHKGSKYHDTCIAEIRVP